MALTDKAKAMLMEYCRLDELTDSGEALLETLYAGAQGYMEQAGISIPEDGTPRRAQYNLCVCALVLDAWDRRELTFFGGTAENPALRRSINQLKLTEGVSGTGAPSEEG